MAALSQAHTAQHKLELKKQFETLAQHMLEQKKQFEALANFVDLLWSEIKDKADKAEIEYLEKCLCVDIEKASVHEARSQRIRELQDFLRGKLGHIDNYIEGVGQGTTGLVRGGGAGGIKKMGVMGGGGMGGLGGAKGLRTCGANPVNSRSKRMENTDAVSFSYPSLNSSSTTVFTTASSTSTMKVRDGEGGSGVCGEGWGGEEGGGGSGDLEWLGKGEKKEGLIKSESESAYSGVATRVPQTVAGLFPPNIIVRPSQYAPARRPHTSMSMTSSLRGAVGGGGGGAGAGISASAAKRGRAAGVLPTPALAARNAASAAYAAAAASNRTPGGAEGLSEGVSWEGEIPGFLNRDSKLSDLSVKGWEAQ